MDWQECRSTVGETLLHTRVAKTNRYLRDYLDEEICETLYLISYYIIFSILSQTLLSKAQILEASFSDDDAVDDIEFRDDNNPHNVHLSREKTDETLRQGRDKVWADKGKQPFSLSPILHPESPTRENNSLSSESRERQFD